MAKQPTDLTPPEICTYCVEPTDAPEDEHAFPESWYPDGVTQDQMLIVPSCPKCNDHYDRLEQRVRGRLGLILGNANDANSRGVADRVLRSMDPSRAKSPRDAKHRAGRRDRLRPNMSIAFPAEWSRMLPAGEMPRPQWLRDLNTGMWQYGVPAIAYEPDDLDEMTRKLVRGVYRALHREPLPPGIAITTPVMTTDPMGNADSIIRKHDLQRRGAPGFAVWHTDAVEDKQSTLTIFLIWGRIVLCGITGQLAAESPALAEG